MEGEKPPIKSALIFALEDFMLETASKAIPDADKYIVFEEDLWGTRDLAHWGTCSSDYGKHFKDGKEYKETFLFTKSSAFLVSIQLEVAVAVELFLLLQGRQNYGNGFKLKAIYPDWYLDGKREPNTFK